MCVDRYLLLLGNEFARLCVCACVCVFPRSPLGSHGSFDCVELEIDRMLTPGLWPALPAVHRTFQRPTLHGPHTHTHTHSRHITPNLSPPVSPLHLNVCLSLFSPLDHCLPVQVFVALDKLLRSQTVRRVVSPAIPD